MRSPAPTSSRRCSPDRSREPRLRRRRRVDRRLGVQGLRPPPLTHRGRGPSPRQTPAPSRTHVPILRKPLTSSLITGRTLSRPGGQTALLPDIADSPTACNAPRPGADRRRPAVERERHDVRQPAVCRSPCSELPAMPGSRPRRCRPASTHRGSKDRGAGSERHDSHSAQEGYLPPCPQVPRRGGRSKACPAPSRWEVVREPLAGCRVGSLIMDFAGRFSAIAGSTTSAAARRSCAASEAAPPHRRLCRCHDA